MNLRQGAGRKCGAQPEDAAECRPVCGSVNIGVLDRYDRLSVARISRGECRIEVIDGGKVSGYYQMISAADRVVRALPIQRVRPEIIEGNHSLQRRPERGRDAGV